MYQDILQFAGLNSKEASIYEILLELGEATASQVYKKSEYKRSLVYKLLDQLEEKGLILRLEERGKVAVFRVEHPFKISELMENQAQKMSHYRKSLEELLPQLVSNYNLAFNKPGVRFFEGKEGARKVAEDSLTAQSEIYSYIDNEAVNKYIPEINKLHVKKRSQSGIKKKMITLDGKYIRERVKNFDKNVTEVHVMDGAQYPFATVMQIYDNKVSYITLSPEEDKIMGIIIEDKNIAQMHRTTFEYNWNNTKAILEPEKETPLVSKEKAPEGGAEEKSEDDYWSA